MFIWVKNPKYHLYPVLDFIEKQMVPVEQSGALWGYNIPYLLTGVLNQHPRTAIAYTQEKRTDYTEFYKSLVDKDWVKNTEMK